MHDWAQLVRDHGPLVWRTAARLLAREPDAADCFQRTFLTAVGLAAAGPVRNWPALLRRIAATRALEQLRRRYRDARQSGVLPDAGWPDPRAADPAAAAAGGELVEALRAALSEIDPAQAEVFCLVCLDGLTNREAAEAVGVTPNHAGVLLHRARAALRDRLRAFDPSPAPYGDPP